MTASALPPHPATHLRNGETRETGETQQVRGTPVSRDVSAVSSVSPFQGVVEDRGGSALDAVIVTVSMVSDVGWERLALLLELRDAVAEGLVRWHQGRAQVRHGVDDDLRARMHLYPDVVEHVLVPKSTT